MIALMVCSGPRPNECAVFEPKKRQGRDERRSLSGPQQLSRFESRESVTVAGRAVSTTTRWAALLGREADARPELSVLAPTEIAQQTSGFRRSALTSVLRTLLTTTTAQTAKAALRQQWGSGRPPHPAGPSLRTKPVCQISPSPPSRGALHQLSRS